MKLPNYARLLSVDTFTFIIPFFHIKTAFHTSPLNTPPGTKTVGALVNGNFNLLAWYFTYSTFFLLNSSLAIREHLQ